MANLVTTPDPKQLEYMTKVFEKFHTPDEDGKKMAASYAYRTLACMPSPVPPITIFTGDPDA